MMHGQDQGLEQQSRSRVHRVDQVYEQPNRGRSQELKKASRDRGGFGIKSRIHKVVVIMLETIKGVNTIEISLYKNHVIV